MRKIFGFTLGGLQQKIFNLVLVFILALIGIFGAVSAYQAKELSVVVNDASDEQQEAIKNVSGQTMHAVINESLTKINAMQAYMADDMFNDVKTDVQRLQMYATNLFENQEDLEFQPVSYPQLDKDGIASVQMQHSEDCDYENSDMLRIISNMQDVLLSMYTTSDRLSSCIIAAKDGTILYADDRSGEYFDEDGNVIKIFDARQRSWYQGAAQTGDIYFSGIERDSFTDYIGVVCSAPVYYKGELVAVVAADIFIDTMVDYVNSTSKQSGYVGVINSDGQFILESESNGVFDMLTDNKSEDLRNSANKSLAKFVDTALSGQTGLENINVNGTDFYMTGSAIPTMGWAVVSFVEKDLTEQAANVMLSEFERINEEASSKFEKEADHSEQTILVMIVLVLILGTSAALYVAGKIVKPVELMTKRIGELNESNLVFQMEDGYHTNDEIEVLAEAFATLSSRTQDYIDQITKITAEKERIGAELELATKIQADMLPNIFPAFPERPEFDIYATMTPAKEVGGDFYDFFLIDDDHLGLVMADVSGKGVPAALFMMMSKILVGNYAMMGGSPAKVLEQVNSQICKNNDEEMFVTVWFGVLEISTGKVTAANAGHEYPMIRKANGEFELFKDKHGFVIGGMDGMRYKDYEFTLEKGGTLFVYTDGVAEATNANNELFGTERMLASLNQMPQAEPKELLIHMKKSVDEFVGEAPQFDDLTMLGVKLL